MKERNSSRRFWNEYIKIYRFRITVSILLIAVVAVSSSFYPLTINWSFKLIEEGNGKFLFIVMLIVPFTRKLILHKVSRNYSKKNKTKEKYIDGESEEIDN